MTFSSLEQLLMNVREDVVCTLKTLRVCLDGGMF